MIEHIVLVFDVGTQSSRACLINNYGQILGKSKLIHEPAYISNHVDYAEINPDYYYEKICEASRNLKNEYPELFAKIEAVSITTIRDTLVCVDNEGKPLRDAILWLDKRKTDGEPNLNIPSKLILKGVSMEKTAKEQYKKAHCNWIRENQPEIWKKTHKCLLISGYLIYKLTNNFTDAVPSMVGRIPMDAKTRTWMKKSGLTYPVFPVEKEKQYPLVEAGETLGYITQQMSLDSYLPQGLKVIASGSDKACEVIGMGCVDSDNIAIGLGTTATISFTNYKYVEPEQFIPPYPSIIKGAYNPEIEIFRGYWLVSWFKKEFALKEISESLNSNKSIEDLLNERLKEIPAGCDGLLFQPYFTPNITMPNAHGAVIGFSDVHTRIHIYRSIIEGINFALIDGFHILQKRCKKQFKKIYIGGGASQSDEICQITADMFGLPVYRTESFEATAIGCAVATFVGLGIFPNYKEAVDKMVTTRDCFQPNFEEHNIYHHLYHDVYKNIFKKLAPLYNNLQNIYKHKKR
ncbi:MAG: FGGY-family carbohydrate kinase [Erysipelotrichaceae bacterium]